MQRFHMNVAVHPLLEIPRSLNTSRECLSFKMTNSENPQDNDQVFALEIEEENVSPHLNDQDFASESEEDVMSPHNMIMIVVYALCALGIFFLLLYELIKWGFPDVYTST